MPNPDQNTKKNGDREQGGWLSFFHRNKYQTFRVIFLYFLIGRIELFYHLDQKS